MHDLGDINSLKFQEGPPDWICFECRKDKKKSVPSPHGTPWGEGRVRGVFPSDSTPHPQPLSPEDPEDPEDRGEGSEKSLSLRHSDLFRREPQPPDYQFQTVGLGKHFSNMEVVRMDAKTELLKKKLKIFWNRPLP